jgi:hypothetical protein
MVAQDEQAAEFQQARIASEAAQAARQSESRTFLDVQPPGGQAHADVLAGQ